MYIHQTFCDTLKRVGKLAWETLISGNPLMRRGKVIKEVGENAFDLGLLIGHGDLRMVRDVTADILVTWPHKTIQEFCGAFYFVMALSEDSSLKSLICGSERPPCLTNSVFLRFCLWFLYSGQQYVSLQIQTAADKLSKYVAKNTLLVHLTVADIMGLCPALDFNDALHVDFFGDVLRKGSLVETLVLAPEDPMELVQRAVKARSVKTITISREYQSVRIPRNSSTDEVSLVVMESTRHVLARLREALHGTERKVRLFLLNCQSSLGGLCLSDSGWKNLHLELNRKECSDLEVTRWPHLKHLAFQNLQVGVSVGAALSSAKQQGLLPSLTHFSLVFCSGFQGALSKFSSGKWLKLTHLKVDFCDMAPNDMRFLVSSLDRSNRKCPFPDLRSLSLHALCFALDGADISAQTVADCIKSLESVLVSFGQQRAPVILSALNLVILTELDLSNTSGLSGQLDQLLSAEFPHLNTLTLWSCDLQECDLQGLAQASLQGKLPILVHLSVSYNETLVEHLGALFSFSNTWSQLRSLGVAQESLEDFGLILGEKRGQGYLASLQKLHISDIQLDCLSNGLDDPWEELREIHVTQSQQPEKYFQPLSVVTRMVEGGFLPGLRVFRFDEFHLAPLVTLRLRQLGVEVHNATEDSAML